MKYLLIPFLFLFFACTTSEKKVPILGMQVTPEGDTSYHQITDFSFINQDGDTITSKDLKGKIYITDFFFTACPTICPKMKAQMHKVYDQYLTNETVIILSHSIDPARDSVSTLKRYAEKLQIDSKKWMLLTGEKQRIYSIAKEYLANVAEDSDAAGGFIHDGNFILVDKAGRIRGYYDGTTDEGTKKLIEDIAILLHEK